MGRRAAELAGVLVASLITSFVTGLALAGPNEPVLYVVGALVPLALLLAYWLWIEPRADADRLRARRFEQAVEETFELTQPQTDASAPRDTPGAPSTTGWTCPTSSSRTTSRLHRSWARRTTPARRCWPASTRRPIPRRRSSATSPPGKTGRETRSSRTRVGRRVAFRHPKGTGPSGRRERLESQVLLVEVWVGDERKRAGEQAKDRYR